MHRRTAGGTLLILFLMATAVRAESQPIDDFALGDFRGKEHRLSSFADARLVVVAFLGAECPLAKLYGPRLEKLFQEFDGRGVQFLGINSNRQDSIKIGRAHV